MKRDMEKETPEGRNLSRREVLGLFGATAAASLVGGVSEQSASAQQASATTHNLKSRIVKFDAKPEPYGVSFTGMACSEPRLIELAYAFEQATKRRVPPPSAP